MLIPMSATLRRMSAIPSLWFRAFPASATALQARTSEGKVTNKFFNYLIRRGKTQILTPTHFLLWKHQHPKSIKTLLKISVKDTYIGVKAAKIIVNRLKLV